MGDEHKERVQSKVYKIYSTNEVANSNVGVNGNDSNDSNAGNECNGSFDSKAGDEGKHNNGDSDH